MGKLTMDEIREKGLLAYEYIRGSHLYGLNVEGSDIDTGGIYIAPIEQIIGLGLDYQSEISKDPTHHDDVWYEINKFVSLLLKSNPTVLEALYVPQDKIISDVHPFVREILENKELFLTKEVFKPLVGYAYNQIAKAKGLKKKIVQPIVERKDVLDFVYTTHKQGSTNIKKWLENRGLKQQYCGLVAINNMPMTFGLYYDWGNHFKNEYQTNGTFKLHSQLEGNSEFNLFIKSFQQFNFNEYWEYSSYDFYHKFINRSIKPIGYKGIVGEDGESNEVRLSSIEDKDARPICIITYNKNGYTSHCKDYKEYKAWEKNRNQLRFQTNLDVGKHYDLKNMMHTMRLMHMAYELATDQGFNLLRTWDKEQLLDIRHGKRDYEELIEEAEVLKDKIEAAIPSCSLKDKPNVEAIDDMLITLRKKQML